MSSQGDEKLKKVSVIVPCRNEKSFIEPFISSVLSQDLDDIDLEILIADGMSDDGTRAVLERIEKKHTTVRVFDNPQKIVSTGLNCLILQSSGDIIIRMDVHTRYAKDYIKKCITLLLEKGVDNVGGAWRAEGKSYLQKAIALAFHSRLSSGGAHSHSTEYEGEVDSVYLGCWKRETLLKLGLFDETLVRNQDDELNLRLVRSGGKVWQSKEILSWYSPRPSLTTLFRQYSQYGYWKIRVIQKHRLPASVRHLVPGAFVATLLFLFPTALLMQEAKTPLFFILVSYFAVTTIGSILACRHRETFRYLPILPFVLATYHIGYGYGFLRGILDFALLHRNAPTAFQTITRQ